MNLIERVSLYLKTWKMVLPHVAPPPPEDAARWGLYPSYVVEAAILRTSKRFAPARLGLDFVPQQAYKYATATARAIADLQKGERSNAQQ